jgi:hypothetical protein
MKTLLNAITFYFQLPFICPLHAGPFKSDFDSKQLLHVYKNILTSPHHVSKIRHFILFFFNSRRNFVSYFIFTFTEDYRWKYGPGRLQSVCS